MLIEIHMLQNHAPSNLNRDDTGSPKEAHFGGVLRARISSQCLKRSIRQSELFREELGDRLATRTRRLGQRLRDELQNVQPATAVDEIVTKASILGSDKPDPGGNTRQLMFLSDAEVTQLAAALQAAWTKNPKGFSSMKLADLEKELGQTLPRSVDVALFGRMTTSAVFPDVPAALQVAHAISTGKVEKQYDYYTGVDDLVQEAEEVGAGMIGDVEFNSATYYKYFCLDWEQLLRNLAGKRDKKNLEGPERAEAEVVARQCLEAVLRAAALTTPTGKQNTFAAHNPPDAILVEVKKRRLPTSYANAFLRPRGPKGDMDVVDESILALAQYAPNLKKTYSIKPELSLLLSTRDHAFPDSERVGNLDQLAERLQAAVSLGAA